MEIKSVILLLLVFLTIFSVNIIKGNVKASTINYFSESHVQSENVSLLVDSFIQTELIYDVEVKLIEITNNTSNSFDETVVIISNSITKEYKQEYVSFFEIKTYYETTISLLVDFKINDNSLDTVPYDSSQYDSDWDGSYGVRASSTVYWEQTYDIYSDLNFVNIVMTDGQWEIFDYQLNIHSREVGIKQVGFFYEGNRLKLYNGEVYNYPSNNTFLYQSPTHFEFTPVFTELTYGMGTFMKCYIERGTSTWYFEFNNTVAYKV